MYHVQYNVYVNSRLSNKVQSYKISTNFPRGSKQFSSAQAIDEEQLLKLKLLFKPRSIKSLSLLHATSINLQFREILLVTFLVGMQRSFLEVQSILVGRVLGKLDRYKHLENILSTTFISRRRDGFRYY